MRPIDQLIHSTVRIECELKNGVSSGTGYFFGFCRDDEGYIPCIVTNKHVISGAVTGIFHITLLQMKMETPF
ncbi:hypothetical protein [Ursidibacter arcticus]